MAFLKRGVSTLSAWVIVASIGVFSFDATPSARSARRTWLVNEAHIDRKVRIHVGHSLIDSVGLQR